MNGMQRFGLLLLGCFAVMVLYPNFDARGWHFIGFTLLGGAAVLLILSVFSNLFAIYRFETLNKIITLGIIAVIIYVLWWHFPQVDNLTPIEKIKDGRTPTKEDIQKGLKRLTFNFDFVHRNVRREENFINQDLEKKAKTPAKKVRAPKSASQQEDDGISIIPED